MILLHKVQIQANQSTVSEVRIVAFLGEGRAERGREVASGVPMLLLPDLHAGHMAVLSVRCSSSCILSIWTLSSTCYSLIRVFLFFSFFFFFFLSTWTFPS